jgi:hypothetical protein
LVQRLLGLEVLSGQHAGPFELELHVVLSHEAGRQQKDGGEDEELRQMPER